MAEVNNGGLDYEVNIIVPKRGRPKGLFLFF